MSSGATKRGQGTGVHPTGELGVWIFLASEGLLFGSVILAYLVARLQNGAAFAAASAQLSLPLGTLNTAVLLTSSFAIASALIWSEAGRNRRARLAIWATVSLGLGFLCIKGFEYWDEAQRGLLPILMLDFRYDGPDPQHARLFFDAYLALTGLHALHLLSGIVLIGSIALLWRRLKDPSHVLRLSALYWHLIDIVWVFLFPLLYLVRAP